MTGDNLVDYYNQRQDVKDAAEEAFPGQDPLQQGTEANEWLKSWWDRTGRLEASDEATKGTFTPTGALEEVVEPAVPDAIEGTLVDYYGTRQDVKDTIEEHFPGQDPFEKGTEAS